MARLKVGDKLEVMVDYPVRTTEVIGNVLTVVKPDGYDPGDRHGFETDQSCDKNSTWSFHIQNIDNGALKLLSSTQMTQSYQFKVGDVTEWPSRDHWEITKDLGNDFEIKLIKNVSLVAQLVGFTQSHPKQYFPVRAKLVSTSHQPLPFFITPIPANVILNVPVVSDGISWTIEGHGIGGSKNKICECGAASVKDHLHSTWCDCYEPTWKNP